ncbi:thioredoxin domain-containing protein [Limnobacter sp. P1]|uniref:thioredoxin domain-containing protein n=1 Tax=Limnobacter olei TaxID=3031298 RepID=UPI0023B0708C|nr:thioredoxin family protein [Limnobacter sp. P1]
MTANYMNPANPTIENPLTPKYDLYLLCANWCRVCREFEELFRSVTNQFPEIRLNWIDIEENPEWEDKVIIESFPTLHIESRGISGRVIFSGAIEPDAQQLRRLIDSFTQTG